MRECDDDVFHKEVLMTPAHGFIYVNERIKKLYYSKRMLHSPESVFREDPNSTFLFTYNQSFKGNHIDLILAPHNKMKLIV